MMIKKYWISVASSLLLGACLTPGWANADCGRKQCGSDGSGGSCGSCPTGMECNAYQRCSCPIEEVSYHGTFYDVRKNSTLDDIVMALHRNGLTFGCQADPLMFCPDCPMPRWQAALFIGRALGLRAGSTCTNPFPDVNTNTVDASTCNMIAQLKSRGVLSGYDTSSYGPNDITTREQAATFLANAFFKPNNYARVSPTFSDVNKDRWSFSFVETVYRECIMEGTSGTRFSPTQKVYREDFALWLARAKNLYDKFPGCDAGEPTGCKSDSYCSGSQVCVNGECVDCRGSSATCSGYSLKRCVNNHWSYSTCSSGACHNGACVECVSGEMEKSCLGNQVKQCLNNKITYTPCGTGMKCYGGVCISDADCHDSEAPICIGGDRVRKCLNGKYYENTCSSGFCQNGACIECQSGMTPPVCVASTMLKSCVNNTFSYTSCPSGQYCENGQCIAKEVVKDCTYGTDPSVTCEGNKLRFCNSSGMYSFSDCTGTMTCDDGKCVACSNTTTKPECSLDGYGNVSVKKCVDNRIVYESCGVNAICNEGTCVSESTPTCTDKTFKPVCEGKNLKTCVDEQFHYSECPHACANGKCVECLDTEEPTCIDNTARSCKSNQYVEQACGSDKVCILGVCEDIPECDQDYTPTCDDEKTVKACNESGKFERTPCKEGYVCKSGRCEYQLECTPGVEPDCVGEQVRTCSNQNKYTLTYCSGELVCDNGKCVTCRHDFPPVCEIDSWGNTMAKVCKNNTFSFEYCKAGDICKDAVGCIDPNVPDCDPTTFTPDCSDEQTARSCSHDSKYTFTPCAGEETCIDGACTIVTTCDSSFVPDCQDNSVRSCSEDGIFTLSPCLESETCIDGTCKQLEGTAECTLDDAPTCEDNNVRACNAAGRYTLTPCVNGTTCQNGECSLSCDPNTPADCAGNNIRTCSNNGEYKLTPCSNNLVCDNGKCVTCRNDTPPTCTTDSWGNTSAKVCINHQYSYEFCISPKVCQEGIGCADPIIKQCDPESFVPDCVGNNFRTCSDDGTYTQIPCVNQICLDGQCVDSPAPECDSSTFINECVDNQIRTCQNNIYKLENCAQNQICVSGVCRDKDLINDDEGSHNNNDNPNHNHQNSDTDQSGQTDYVDSSCAMHQGKPTHNTIIPVLWALLGCLVLRRRYSKHDI